MKCGIYLDAPAPFIKIEGSRNTSGRGTLSFIEKEEIYVNVLV
jgi:hypothetical protein